MISTHPSLTQEAYLNTNLIPVALPSAANPCPICQDPFSASSPPALLRECGHIFCRPCITAWFDSGLDNANTCPLDRCVLFAANRDADEVTDGHGASAGATREVSASRRGRARVVRPVVELFVDGEIVAVDGVLTRDGCKHVVWDMWRRTMRLLRRFDGFSGEEVDDLVSDSEFLVSSVRDALPRGVRCGEGACLVLCTCARYILVWQNEYWEEMRENRDRVPVEDLETFVEDLYQACGGHSGR